jgi:hypothetical protein
MIARETVRGRITQLRVEEVPAGWRPSYVQIELQDSHGVLRQCRLTSRDAVYVLSPSADEPVRVLDDDSGELGKETKPIIKPGVAE